MGENGTYNNVVCNMDFTANTFEAVNSCGNILMFVLIKKPYT